MRSGRPQADWSKLEQYLRELGSRKAVARELGVSTSAVHQQLAPGLRTSVYLRPDLARRWAVARRYTGLTGAALVEQGLVRVEAELTAAFAWPPGKPCWHEARWPNGRCTRCYESAWGSAEFEKDFDAERDAEASVD